MKKIFIGSLIAVALVIIGITQIAFTIENNFTLTKQFKDILYYYELLVDEQLAKDSEATFSYQPVGVRHKYQALESVAGIALFRQQTRGHVPVFLKRPHTDELNYKSNTFGYYNPQFVQLVYQSIDSLMHDRMFKVGAQLLYDKHLKELAQSYYHGYLFVHNHDNAVLKLNKDLDSLKMHFEK